MKNAEKLFCKVGDLVEITQPEKSLPWDNEKPEEVLAGSIYKTKSITGYGWNLKLVKGTGPKELRILNSKMYKYCRILDILKLLDSIDCWQEWEEIENSVFDIKSWPQKDLEDIQKMLERPVVKIDGIKWEPTCSNYEIDPELEFLHKKLSYLVFKKPKNIEYLDYLLQWTCDGNWPVAEPIYDFFIRLGEKEAHRVMEFASRPEIDHDWRCWLITDIIVCYNTETLKKNVNFLINWAKSPATEGVDIEALRILSDEKLVDDKTMAEIAKRNLFVYNSYIHETLGIAEDSIYKFPLKNHTL